MLEKINKLKTLLQEHLSDTSAQQEFAILLDEMSKEQYVLDFKLQRMQKDKNIVTNLLHKSILDLEHNQKMLAEHNELLVQQKQEIEEKNALLQEQKNKIKEQSDRLKINLHELETSYREMEQFTYIASHDLRSPLQNISNFAQLLDKRYNEILPEPGREFLNFIITGARRMDQVISDLLTYSRIGGRDKSMITMNITDIVDLIKINLREEIERQEVVIETTGLPQICGNRSSIIQLFQHLIHNAIKFSRSEEAPIIQVSCEAKEGYWTFIVSDNGAGLDECYQDKAFLPFQRINMLDRPGLGMGLAICKKVINLHRGRIWYQANDRGGTDFCFTLPQLSTQEIATSSKDVKLPISKLSAS